MNPLLISGFGTSINVDKRKLIIQNKLKNVLQKRQIGFKVTIVLSYNCLTSPDTFRFINVLSISPRELLLLYAYLT